MKSTFFPLSNITTVFSDNLYLQYSDYCNKAKFIGSSIFFIKKSKQSSFCIDLYIYFCKIFLREPY